LRLSETGENKKKKKKSGIRKGDGKNNTAILKD